MTHFMNHVYQRDHILNRSLRQNAVAQIENVPVPSVRLLQNRFSLRAQVIAICKQGNRIEVPHHAYVRAYAFPGFIKPHTPINSDHIAARFAHQLQ
jgi:hypothetical protein